MSFVPSAMVKLPVVAARCFSPLTGGPNYAIGIAVIKKFSYRRGRNVARIGTKLPFLFKNLTNALRPLRFVGICQ